MRDNEEWVYLKAEYLKRLLGSHHARNIRNALEWNKIITVYHPYVKGDHSKGFNLHPQYLNNKIKKHQLTDPALLARIKQHYPPQLPNPNCPLEQQLFHWLCQLRINYKLAKSRIMVEISKDDSWQFNNYTWLEQFHNQEFRFKRDDYGRVHTNLSNCWSELRRYITINNEYLVNIDIANSQPLFLFLTVRDWFVKELINKTHTQPPPTTHREYDAQALNKLTNDLDQYRQQVEAGTFYEYMMGQTNAKCLRETFKTKFYANVLFQKKNYDSIERQAFSQSYPTAYQALRQMKDKSPTLASHLLQRQESQFMIDTVCNSLFTKLPNTPVLTIHDSIMTTVSQAQAVIDTIKEEFAKIGLKPKLNVKH